MKKLLLAICWIGFGASVVLAGDYSRMTLMDALKSAETEEAAQKIFTDFIRKAPDMELSYDIYRMWSANEPEAAQAFLDDMRADPLLAGRLVYFEGAAMENLPDRIDFCRKRIMETPDRFEPYALMFDTYTKHVFMKELEEPRGGSPVTPEVVAQLEKGMSPDNEKMVRIRDWKTKGEYVDQALKYMAYYGFYKGHLDDAMKYFKEAEGLGSDWLDYSHMAVTAMRLKDAASARDYVNKYADTWVKRGAVPEQRRKEMADGVLMAVLTKAGAYDEAISELQSREGYADDPDALYNLACLHSQKGDKDKAFEILDKAIAGGFSDRELMETDPDLNGLRSDPRWTASKTALDEAWTRGEADRIKAAVALKIEKDAPAWELKDPDGKVYKLADYTGKKVVILDFWATWCNPCMMAMPKLHEWTLKKNENVEVFSINTWERQPDNAKKLFADRKYAMRLLMNGDETGVAYGLQGIPYICVIDKNGKIRYEMKGFSPALEQNLTYWVNDLLQ